MSYLDARAHDGTWLVRIDDIDPPREIAGAADSILRSLEAHGLNCDESPRFQSQSRQLHDDAVRELLDEGALFFCSCARKMLRRTQPTGRYPGTCRQRGLDKGALRVRVEAAPIEIQDRWQSTHVYDLSADPGDFIVRRRDGLIAYQLACVIDDAAQNITHVVRGIDLFESTPRQHYLQSKLQLPHPDYAHFPVVIGKDGDKLSKQTGAHALDSAHAGRNLAQALDLLGFNPPPTLQSEAPANIVAWAQLHYVTTMFRGQQQIAQYS